MLLATTTALHIGDPVEPLVLALAFLLTSAKLGGELAVRLGQPAVLGELCVGVLLGNSALWGLPSIAALAHEPVLDLLARIGVRDMLRVGLPSLLTALLGVVVPFALGYAAMLVLAPSADSCGTVIAVNVIVTYDDGIALDRMTIVEGACNELGNSGGPWIDPYRGKATGIHSGGRVGCPSGFSVYQEVDRALADLGVKLKTL